MGGVAGVVVLGLLAWVLIRRTARNRAGPFLIEDAEQYIRTRLGREEIAERRSGKPELGLHILQRRGLKRVAKGAAYDHTVFYRREWRDAIERAVAPWVVTNLF